MLGSGTAEDPYQITNVTELQLMKDNLSAYYILVNDIDASDTINWNGGAGFIPIGNSTNAFFGALDGKEYEINALYIKRSTVIYVGLFGYLSTTKYIKNLGLLNVNITGLNNVGALVGKIYTGSPTIEKCYSTGQVHGASYVGGLIGEVATPATIRYCYSEVSVFGNVGGTYVGGLVGRSTSAEYIYECYSVGNVIGGNEVGGFIGTTSSSCNVINCYSWGNVTITSNYGRGGGFVGGNNGVCSKSYSVGFLTVPAHGYFGGFCGQSYGTISYCYYDKETSGQSDTGKGIPKTTAEMKQQATFVTWDFEIVWYIEENITYPTFIWQLPVSAFIPKIIMII